MTEGLKYAFGASSGEVSLTSDGSMLASSLDLRSSEWSYDLGTRSLQGATRKAVTRKAAVAFADPRACDETLARLDLDVSSMTPGTLVAEGGWSQRALVVAHSPQAMLSRGGCVASLTVALLDGAWWRWLAPVELTVWDGSGQADAWLDYPHPYPHGYATGRRAESIDVPTLAPCAARLTLWGPCVGPSVTIGGNAYSLPRLTLGAGERCVLDGTTFCATRIGRDGTATDVTALAVREGGEGGGTYAFERVRPGTQAVLWDGSFGVTVELREERGEPTWAR